MRPTPLSWEAARAVPKLCSMDISTLHLRHLNTCSHRSLVSLTILDDAPRCLDRFLRHGESARNTPRSSTALQAVYCRRRAYIRRRRAPRPSWRALARRQRHRGCAGRAATTRPVPRRRAPRRATPCSPLTAALSAHHGFARDGDGLPLLGEVSDGGAAAARGHARHETDGERTRHLPPGKGGWSLEGH